MTTRPKTENDVEGVDYFFVTREQFEQHRQAGELLEWAQVFGHYYGTPRQAVADNLAQDKVVILEIDVQGAIQVRRNMPEVYALFVLPPSEESLLQRLRNRKREDEAIIQQRFAKARAEIAQAHDADVYDAFIVNDDLDRAVDEAVGLIEAACRVRCTDHLR